MQPRVLIWLLLPALLLGLLFWRLLEPSGARGGLAPAAAEGGVEAGAGELAASPAEAATRREERPQDGPAPAPYVPLGPEVVSAVELPLGDVEVARDGRPWERVALVEGFLPLEAEGEALRVRAAGHADVAVQPGDEIVVLPALASLTLVGAGLRERLGEVRLAAGLPEPERWLFAGTRIAGFVGDDRWVLALAPDPRRSELECWFELDGSSRLRVELYAAPGNHALLPVPPPAPAGERLPLVVELRGAATPVHLSVEARERLSRGVLRDAGSGVLAEWEQVVDPEPFERDLAPGTHELRAYPRGRALWLQAAADATGAQASLTTTSDGAPKVLELAGGRVLTGRVVADRGAPPARVDLAWRFEGEGQAQTKFRQGMFREGLALGADGSFRVGVPDDPIWAGVAAGPVRLRLDVDAPGFESLERVVELRPARPEYDLGALVLPARTPELVLVPPHPADRRPLLDQVGDAYVLGLPDAPEVRHWVNSVREVRRGSAAQPIAHYEVFLQRMLGANGKPRYEIGRLRYTWEETDPPRPEALVLVQSGEAYPYERTAGGEYRGVACRAYELELDVHAFPMTATRLELAWTWRGLVVPIDRYGAGDVRASEVGDVLPLHLFAPDEGVALLVQPGANLANDGSPYPVGPPQLVPLTPTTRRVTVP